MKIKSGLKAGEGAGGTGGEILTGDAAEQIVTQCLDEAGVPSMREDLTQLQERQQRFEQRARSGNLASAEWWLHDDLIHNGISRAVLPGVKERVRADFGANRGEDEVFPGQNAARSMRAVIMSAVSEKGQEGLRRAGVREPVTPQQYAAKVYGEEHIVTQGLAGKLEVQHDVASDRLDSDKAARIGVTIPEAFLPGFVPFLRARSVVLAAGPVEAPMERGALSFLVQTSGTTFSYVASPTDVPARTSLDFASRNFKSRYLRGLVVWSLAAVRRSSIVGDALILNDMLAGGADAVDDAGLLGDGTGAEPKGLRNLIHTDHSVAAPVLTASMTNIEMIHNVELAFRLRLNAIVGDENITPGRLVLFMSYRDFLYFMTGRTDNGSLAWPSIESNGTLMSLPVFWTGRIATNEPTPNNIGSTIMGMDMTQFVFAEEEALDVDVSFVASVTDGTGSYNLWERNSAAAKLMAEHDFGVLRDKAGFVLTGVNYGGLALT